MRIGEPAQADVNVLTLRQDYRRDGSDNREN